MILYHHGFLLPCWPPFSSSLAGSLSPSTQLFNVGVPQGLILWGLFYLCSWIFEFILKKYQQYDDLLNLVSTQTYILSSRSAFQWTTQHIFSHKHSNLTYSNTRLRFLPYKLFHLRQYIQNKYVEYLFIIVETYSPQIKWKKKQIMKHYIICSHYCKTKYIYTHRDRDRKRKRKGQKKIYLGQKKIHLC